MGEQIIKDFVQNILEYNPKIKSNPQLRDDLKFFMAYYSSRIVGNNSNDQIDLNEVIATSRSIYSEILFRKEANTMEYELDISKLRPEIQEIFNSFDKAEPAPKELKLSDSFNEDIVLIQSAVSFSHQEIMINIDENLGRLIKSILYKTIPDEVAKEFNISSSSGRATEPVPLFDLVLKRRELQECPQNGVRLSQITPASSEKVVYSIPDLLEVCFA